MADYISSHTGIEIDDAVNATQLLVSQLSGSAVQGLALVDGALPTMITDYTVLFNGGLTIDEIAGTITVSKTKRHNIGMFFEMNETGALKDFELSVYLFVNAIQTQIMSSVFVPSFNAVSQTFVGGFPLQKLVALDVISLAVGVTGKNVNIDVNSSIFSLAETQYL